MSDRPVGPPWPLGPHTVAIGRVRERIVELQDEAVDELHEVEGEIERLAERRRELLQRIDLCRESLYGAVDALYHLPKTPRPVDAMGFAAGSRIVTGPALRAALTKFVMSTHQPLGVNDLLRRLAAHDLWPSGEPVKAVSDALRWEVKAGRVRKLARGLWSAPA